MNGIEVEDRIRQAEGIWTRRVEQLAGEHRRTQHLLRMTQIGLVVFAGLSLATGLGLLSHSAGAARADAFEARRFVLRDEEGLTRGLWEVSRDGGSQLILQDVDGRQRLKLSLLNDGSPGVTFTDRQGRVRAVLGVLPDQTTNLVLADQNGITRAVLGYSSEDAVSLLFADRDGTTRAGLVVDEVGVPSLTLTEQGPGAVLAPSSEVDSLTTASDAPALPGTVPR